MTDQELIYRQAKQIEEMRDALHKIDEQIEGVRYSILGIGGPLNDNRLKFNADQRSLFIKIDSKLGQCQDIFEELIL